jgi:Chaperone of endosialidase
MNSTIQCKTKILPLLIAAVFAWFGLFPIAEAVVPPPDGGYPGGNTAEGQAALLSLTTGGFNTAVGWLSLRSNVTTSFNTAIGAGALLANTADRNTATGAGALLSNTTGPVNTASGAFALFSNTEGSNNTAVGESALFSNTTGFYNTATGRGALENNTTGSSNTATGLGALDHNTTGEQNTASGVFALAFNTTGEGNTANGYGALLSNNTGVFNTANGFHALYSNTTGSGNTALGYTAGSNLTTGGDNICIGNDGVAGDAAVIRIGRSFIAATYIAGISGKTASGGAAVFVNSEGKLGTSTSSARFKDDIKPMGKASEALFALKPVTFYYKKEIDPRGIPQFGLVAEDVEKVNPELVVRDAEGKVNTVRYEQINTMLLNEFLKEHRTVQGLKATLGQQQKEIATLIAHIKEQDAKIQKVSDQLEMSKAAPRVASVK